MHYVRRDSSKITIPACGMVLCCCHGIIHTFSLVYTNPQYTYLRWVYCYFKEVIIEGGMYVNVYVLYADCMQFPFLPYNMHTCMYVSTMRHMNLRTVVINKLNYSITHVILVLELLSLTWSYANLQVRLCSSLSCSWVRTVGRGLGYIYIYIYIYIYVYIYTYSIGIRGLGLDGRLTMIGVIRLN